jgi:hypothetical protein
MTNFTLPDVIPARSSWAGNRGDTVWTICGRGGGGAGGVAADSPYRNVRPKKIKNDANGRGVFIEMGGFASISITPPEAFARQKAR